MEKSNKSIAGYHLLMILSAVDYKFYCEEEMIIRDYLAEEFPFHVNLDKEMEIISQLQPSDWKNHFEFQAHCFLEDSSLEDRKNFLKFAEKLIQADDKITKREIQFVHMLENIWQIEQIKNIKMRKNIVAGNWKMNKNLEESILLIGQLLDYTKKHTSNCEIYIAPPALYLTKAKELLGNNNIGIFSQDISQHENGAYTGEISAEMLKSVDIKGSLVGHSERRLYHAENDEQINLKIKKALEKGLTPIYCNGENLEQRKNNQHFEVVKRQTETALFSLSTDEIKKIVIAYEPVWAIGTGETASPEQVQEIHAYIRSLIAEKYGADVANEISILYGGSVKPNNAKEIFSQPDVDGGLIGGASLKIEDFTAIIEGFN